MRLLKKNEKATIQDLLISFIAMGFEELNFWGLTPKMFYIHKLAAVEKANIEYELAVTAAWIAGTVSKSEKAIKLSDLIPSKDEFNGSIDNQDYFVASLSELSISHEAKSWADWVDDLNL